MKSLTMSFITLMIPMFALANVVNAKVTGIVKSFDEKKVVLIQDGKAIEVPRQFFDKIPLKAGNTVSTKELSPADLERIQ